MKKYSNELSVGVFVFLGLLCVAYLTLKLGNVELFADDGYTLNAKFNSITGLRQGAEVEVAGVTVGKVTSIKLVENNSIYQANVQIRLPKDLTVYEDATASIKTSGIIGDKYVHLEPGGGCETRLVNGAEIEDTNSTIDIESLISKYVFGGIDK
ncbi:MAG: outer membrane lipid asymmetry maintenance protein MlaD [Deltaproteobacteria bacterium]|jgi:phospholipid/cholesterol/gamma-HCH transport system substrate-binding protein|nr:outer membrane lipid asymmetry maintenance protein MlaD [Deltaproteobacteria bacterium]